MITKIIFVYNANSGLGNSILGSAHKIFSPSTYNCNLCDITFGVFTENAVWKNFREETDLEFVFLHKDEFKTMYKDSSFLNTSLPIVLKEEGGKLRSYIATKELNTFKDVTELIKTIKSML